MKKIISNMEEKKEGPSFFLSTRFLMALLVFAAYLVQYMQKMMTSVGIVCMVNSTWVKEQSDLSKQLFSSTMLNSSNHFVMVNGTGMNHEVENRACLFQHIGSHLDGQLKWDKASQGLVLASFFWGYIITEIPGGYLATRFGTKIVLFMGFLIASVATVLLPVCARAHIGLFIFVRVVNGAALGVLWPATAAFWSQWAPPKERSILIGIGNSGAQIGNTITIPLAGYLCMHGFDQGWGSIYYIFGILGFIWCAVWFIIGSDSPKTHKFISENEKEYITFSTKDTASAHAESESLTAAPWKEIMTSKACNSFFATLTCNNWGTYVFLTNIPTYMKEVLKFDIKSNGGMAAIPYLLFWITIISSGIVADKILQKSILNRTKLRRVTNGIAMFVPMSAVIGLIFIDCSNPYGGLALLCLGLAITGVGYGAGFMVNSNDISGQYAGLVFGIGNTYGTIPGIIAPYIVGYLTPNALQSEWRNVFIIAAVIYFIGGTQAVLFTAGEVEPWAKSKPSKRTNSDDKNSFTQQFHQVADPKEFNKEQYPNYIELSNNSAIKNHLTNDVIYKTKL